MTIEADRFQDLQLASWRPRTTESVVPARVQRPENQESWWYSFSPVTVRPVTVRLKTQEEPLFQIKSKDKKTKQKQWPSSKRSGRKKFPLAGRSFSLSVVHVPRPSTDWMGPTHLREGHLLSSVSRFKCLCHPEIPSQAHSESCLAKCLGSLWPCQVDA